MFDRLEGSADAGNPRLHAGAGFLRVDMYAAHKEAVEAEQNADRAERYADDLAMPSGAPLRRARDTVDHAVRAQTAAGVETTAADARVELERQPTPAEYVEQESTRRHQEAEREVEERAATGMARENRDRAANNQYLAERHATELGGTVGHAGVLEAAACGQCGPSCGESGRRRWLGMRVTTGTIGVPVGQRGTRA